MYYLVPIAAIILEFWLSQPCLLHSTVSHRTLFTNHDLDSAAYRFHSACLCNSFLYADLEPPAAVELERLTCTGGLRVTTHLDLYMETTAAVQATYDQPLSVPSG